MEIKWRDNDIEDNKYVLKIKQQSMRKTGDLE